MLPDRAALHSAATVVYRSLKPTAQYAWPLISEALGTEAWIKHENHTPVGAFKLRGGLVYFDELHRRQPDCRGVITATKGNHGQSVGYAARTAGIPATVYVPFGNSREKNAAMRALGVTLVEHGHDFQSAREEAVRVAAERHLHMVPAFHPDLIRGVATYWLELFEAVPDIDIVFVAIGQGSGINACIAAREALGLSTRIIGVVSSAAPCYALSYRAGKVIEAPAETQIADGLACRVPDADALANICHYADDIVEVSDAEIATAMRLLFAATHNVAEGAGAAPLAAATKLRHMLASKKIAMPVSGGNVDTEQFARVLAGANH
jgi:threonine dehydratase